MQSFDSTGNPLLLLSPLGFPLFLALLLNPPQSPSPPIAGLLSHTWSNPLPQLVLIDRLLSLPSDTFNFSALPSPQRSLTRDDVADAPLGFVNSTWNCKDIFEVCRQAAASEDAGVREKSNDILEKGVKVAPELVALGMVQATVSSSHPRPARRIPCLLRIDQFLILLSASFLCRNRGLYRSRRR